MTHRILLTGATGYVGHRLLPKLMEKGDYVRCMVRTPSRFHGEASDVVRGDVFDKASLSAALEGIDTAYYLIHSMGEEGNFVTLDREAAANFAEAAAEQGVKRIIYLGGLGADEQELSSHLRSRHEVGEVLRDKAPGVCVIELRASIVIGSGSLSFEMVRALTERLPFMVTPRWVWAKAQPIGIQDLTSYLIEALDISVSSSEIIEIGGADQLSYADLMSEYGRQRGLYRLMIPVPVITPYLSSLWLHLVTPVYSTVGKKLVESACYETTVRSDKAEKLFKTRPAPIAEAFRLALEKEDSELEEEDWIAHYFPKGELPDRGTFHLGGRIVDIKSVEVPVSKQRVFDVIRRIGGQTGWYYGNWLWQLRGFLDSCIGGVGLRRGRRDPDDLIEGEALDFWRVEKFEPNKRLRLAAEMKVPGRAWLEFNVEGDGNHCRIHQIAIFDPLGISGLLYWYGLYFLHSFVFSGMIRGIANAAAEEKAVAGLEFFVRRKELPVSVNEAFAWHKRAGAFDRLAPPWEKIEIIDRKGGIEDGGQLTFKMTVGLISLVWHAVHEYYIPNKQFCDVQVRGPFAFWKHKHLFEESVGNTTYMTDSVAYKLPGGVVGKWLFGHHAHVALEKLFRFRHKRTEDDLLYHKKYQGVAPMKILIAGSSGLIGKQLTAMLTTAGHEVMPLVRKEEQRGIHWNPQKGELDPLHLEGYDAIINLAGESIADGRWTEKKKQRIRDSRVLTTRTIAEALTKLNSDRPKVWINASATGYYGDGKDHIFDEESPHGKGFLAMVCDEWEAATKPAVDAGVRVVTLRTGIVLTPQGGALAQMLTPFKMGVGGVLGDGRQYMSWISLEDEIRIILHCLHNESISGPVNAVTPNPVTNRAFTKTLGRVLKRPTILPMPKFVVKLIFGEMGEELLLNSCRVTPKKLLDSNYQFFHPELDGALRELLGR